MPLVNEARHPRIVAITEEARVTPLELFLDLVFVFAITQVTALMADDLTVRGLVQGLLVLGLVWWCWVGYAWLGAVVRADEGLGRVAMFGAMAAVFVLAITIPEAFRDIEGGLSGPVVVAFAYLAVRVLHLAIFWMAAGAEGDDGLRRQLLRFAPSLLGSTVLLLIASQLEGVPQIWVWVAALVVDYVGTILGGASGWRLNSAGLFAERHGLIVIVALGESIVAIGLGIAHEPVSWAIIVASVLGLTVSGCLWWAYFDVVALAGERLLRAADGEVRARIARDAYSYLHLPMIAGIVLGALGFKKVLEYVSDTSHHTIDEPLALVPLAAMYGGVALYLFAHVAFRFRNWHHVTVDRLVVGLLLLALIPLAARIPALAAFGALSAVMVGMIVFETMHYSEFRDRIRREEKEEELRLEGS
ncbi:MAG TPA: low temperature requirement protein A [Actinomycetota bacterium]|nr:low temperature requirement protein A [Actinomycetota bacterium]